MAASMTFGSLVLDVQAYLDRGSLTDAKVNARIPTFINEAERLLAKMADLQGFNEVLTFSLTNGVATYPKPDRWRRTISMRYGTNLVGAATFNESSPIYSRAYEYIRTMWPDESKTAAPKWYADYDLAHWVIGPTPNQNYPAEVIIKAMPQLLDQGNQTNFFTQYTPQSLRLAALVNAATFTGDFEKAGVYQGQLDKISGADGQEDLRKMADRAATRQQA